jgi:hypothetical protein
MFFIANAHNSIGRFYEVQSYGPDNYEVRPPATTTSREWFRANPPLPHIKWGPRNNVNIQQSGVLIALNHVAKNREMYLENYWLKNKRSVEKGRGGPTYAWVVPANQRRKADAADAVNELRRQGLEIHTATSSFRAGGIDVRSGDYVIRADQPYRTLADMYFSLQSYSPANPRPYDDTGWTFQLMRNVVVTPVADRAILTASMAPLANEARAAGGISGSGSVLVVDHTSDNNLMAFRFKHRDVAMQAAEDDFEAAGRRFRAGSFIVPNANRATLESTLRELGISAWAVGSAPSVRTHELDIPRIGYVHAWHRTQDEGWVRAALDTYGVPYTYFADQKLREGNLRSKYDVIIYPHVGGTAQQHVNGIPKTTGAPLPYKKTEATPNLGVMDQSDDIRGGMGLDGLAELQRFVEQGGTLIVEGSTATIFPEYGLTSGVTVENPTQLFARGAIMRGIVTDRKSPLAYGFDAQLPIYFNQAPVLNVAGGGQGAGGGGFNVGPNIPGVGQNTTPMATRPTLSAWDGDSASAGGRGRAARDSAALRPPPSALSGQDPNAPRPRVVMQFPANESEMLLSGTLVGGQTLANRAQLVDLPLGQGHIVMFAIRPFWRWQTQGTYFLGFNAILNWNDLDAGKAAPAAARTAEGR